MVEIEYLLLILSFHASLTGAQQCCPQEVNLLASINNSVSSNGTSGAGCCPATNAYLNTIQTNTAPADGLSGARWGEQTAYALWTSQYAPNYYFDTLNNSIAQIEQKIVNSLSNIPWNGQGQASSGKNCTVGIINGYILGQEQIQTGYQTNDGLSITQWVEQNAYILWKTLYWNTTTTACLAGGTPAAGTNSISEWMCYLLSTTNAAYANMATMTSLDYWLAYITTQLGTLLSADKLYGTGANQTLAQMTQEINFNEFTSMNTLSSIKSDTASIINIISQGEQGGDKTGYQPISGLWIPLINSPIDTYPLFMDFVTGPGSGEYNATGGLYDLAIGSAMTTFGIGIECGIMRGNGRTVGNSGNTQATSLDQLPYTAPNQGNSAIKEIVIDSSGNYFTRLSDPLVCGVPATATNLTTIETYFAFPNARTGRSQEAPCNPGEIPLWFEITLGPTFWETNGILEVVFSTLIGYQDVTDPGVTYWYKTGGFTMAQIVYGTGTGGTSNCNGVNSLTRVGTCNVRFCINPGATFRPSTALDLLSMFNAFLDGNSQPPVNAIVWPQPSGNVYSAGCANTGAPTCPQQFFWQIQSRQLYGGLVGNNYANGSNGQNTGPTTWLTLGPDSSAQGVSQLRFYICSVYSTVVVKILAQGEIKFQAKGGDFQTSVSTYPSGPPNMWVEWLPMKWNEKFNDQYAYAQWAKFGIELGGDNTLFVATELDPDACNVAPGDTLIPQRFWVVRADMYLNLTPN